MTILFKCAKDRNALVFGYHGQPVPVGLSHKKPPTKGWSSMKGRLIGAVIGYSIPATLSVATSLRSGKAIKLTNFKSIIGGALGATAGAKIGESIDEERSRRERTREIGMHSGRSNPPLGYSI